MTSLLADIGGTRARFALLSDAGQISLCQILACDDFSGPVAAAEAFLAGSAAGCERPRRGAFAVAATVDGSDRIELTNRNWSFSLAETRQRLGLEDIAVMNDFAALTLALPSLSDIEAPYWQVGRAAPAAPMAVLGPGTGLGVASLLSAGDRWLPIASEGGHRDLAATTPREWEVIQVLAARFGHVSAERMLSGPGLVNLYTALCQLEGRPDPGGQRRQTLDPAQISQRAKEDPLAREALEIFASQLGAIAGDLALTVGARGGVFVAGGVVPALGAAFPRRLFLRRFSDKGRFQEYLASIPIRLVTHDHPALVGLAYHLRR